MDKSNSAPVMKPLHTNSTGNTEHFFMTVMLGSGWLSTAFFTMCVVLLNHHMLVWFSTCKQAWHARA